ncbi:MAG: hypothetical protein NUV81_00920 [bacterium]|nr:hypothetical protein [bacterium]
MNSEQYAISLSRDEMLELYRALVSRAFVEDELRNEKGLEDVGERALLVRVEALLRLTQGEGHQLLHEMDDELWEYAWFSVSDEWAWYRALQEERTALGTGFDAMNEQELRGRVERRYQKDFERFVHEIEMMDIRPKGRKKPRATNA